MSELAAAAAAPAKLTVFATVRGAYRDVFGRPLRLCKAVMLPLLIIVGLSVAALPLEEAESGIHESLLFVQFLPYVFLGVCWSRLELLGGELELLAGSAAYRRYLLSGGYSLLVLGLLFLAAFAAGGFAHAMSLGEGIAVLTGVGTFLLAAWPTVRLCLVFPATAIDEGLGPVAAWRLGRGNGLRLFTACLITSLPMLALTVVWILVSIGFFQHIADSPGDAILTDISTWLQFLAVAAVPNAIQLIGFTLIVSVFAKAYAQLSGWGAPREEILERFE